MRTSVLTIALALILGAAGCASQARINEMQPAPAGPEAAAQLPVGDLPPLPDDRAASDTFGTLIDGRDTYDRSSNATPVGSTLILAAGTAEIAWAVWCWPIRLEDLVRLAETLAYLEILAGTDVYVGVADYEARAWDFSEGAFFGHIFLDKARHISPAGNCYVVVIAFDASTARVDQLHLVLEDTWVIDRVAGTSFFPEQTTSLAEVDGNPAISYASNGSLLYARAIDAVGSFWDTMGGICDGFDWCKDSSLVVVDGRPAICYDDNMLNQLKYVRATDAAGNAWSTPQVVDADGNVGRNISMAVVDGRPAISYYDETNGDLLYIRADDATGSAWGARVTVDTGGGINDTGLHSSLAVVAGRPAISYYDVSATALRYVRANDATGNAWGTSVICDGAGVPNIGQYTTLVVVDGNPAISYYDATNTKLKYIRADNPIGSSWGSRNVLDSGGMYASMAVVDGRPAISYNDDGDLKYIEALDADGSDWRAPRVLEECDLHIGNGPYVFCSLAAIGGSPAISYGNWEFSDLKFAINPGL